MSLKSRNMSDWEDDAPVVENDPSSILTIENVKTVIIPVHIQGIKQYKTISVPWTCLECGKKKGDPRLSSNGRYHLWVNPCGHHDTYKDLWENYQGLPAVKKSLADVIEPYYMWEERET